MPKLDVRFLPCLVARAISPAILIQLRVILSLSLLRRRGFAEYLVSGGEVAYQQLCGEITAEFNDCSKQVRVHDSFSGE